MKKPVLVVMAAGMGSRYGGLKQIDPVGPDGEVIIDYSIYDAVQAGFEKVVFIIKRAIEDEFKSVIGARIGEKMEVAYAFQELDMLPAGVSIPAGREKPWGTSHAVLCARDVIDGPFAVINADDYYGPSAYKVLYDFLASDACQSGQANYAMVGYLIENTVTDKGTVARGVCEADENGMLNSIVERLKIAQTETGARFTEDDGATWTDIPAGTLVSMNYWGFNESLFPALEASLKGFLAANLEKNPLKCECLLPNSVGDMIKQGVAGVRVLSSPDRWYGVTYKEDKPGVVAAIAEKHKAGVYPTPLWSNMGR